MKTYNMLDYDTGRVVGRGTAQLAKASAEDTTGGGVGACYAYQRSDGLWDYVPESVARGMDGVLDGYRVVYLDPSVSAGEVES